MTGTPKTLSLAILNACQEINDTIPERLPHPCKGDVEIIKKHVQDFLAQKFSVYYLDSNHEELAREIWASVFKETT